jgi:colicin import membrane protein
MDGSVEAALVEVPRETALQVFTTPKAIDPYLAKVREEIDRFVPDVSTKKGRDQIASIAYKVAKCKTYLDGVGKELNDAQKEIPKRIDATRKFVRDTLDAWKDEVRRPLTEWEQAEESRVAAIKSALAELQGVIDDREERSPEALRERLAGVKAESITAERFAEYMAAAAELQAKAIAALESAIEKAEKRAAEAAELARLRAEAEERARKDREAQIAREAEERAKAEAERQAQAEREAAAKREADLKAAAERAERERVEAQQRAERAEAEAKAKAEREVREQQEREAAELAAREADKAHKGKVNRAAVAALVAAGIPDETARVVITLIAKRAVPAVQIHY